jgi:hypothetical protein
MELQGDLSWLPPPFKNPRCWILLQSGSFLQLNVANWTSSVFLSSQ